MNCWNVATQGNPHPCKAQLHVPLVGPLIWGVCPHYRQSPEAIVEDDNLVPEQEIEPEYEDESPGMRPEDMELEPDQEDLVSLSSSSSEVEDEDTPSRGGHQEGDKEEEGLVAIQICSATPEPSDIVAKGEELHKV